MKNNKNYKNRTIFPMIFIFTIMSFFSLPAPTAHAYLFQDTVEGIENFFYPKDDSSSESSNENNSQESSSNDVSYNSSFSGEISATDSDDNIITNVNQLRDSFDNVNTFSPFGSYSNKDNSNNNSKNKKKELAFFLASESDEIQSTDISLDYDFNFEDVSALNSLFSVDDNEQAQADYDKYANGEYSDDSTPVEDEDTGILADISNLTDDMVSSLEEAIGNKIATATGVAVATYTLYAGLIQGKKEEDAEEIAEEDGNNNDDVNEDSDLISNEDGIDYNNLEGNKVDNDAEENYTPYTLSSADYAKIESSIANMPNASSLCNSSLLSTIKNFIGSTTDYWQGEDLSKLASCIISKANQYKVNPLVICAQIKQESGFIPTAGSPAGAVGISQFMPSTAESLGIDPWNVEEAIQGQCEYMSNMMKSFGDYSLALAGYNAGGGAVSSYGGIPPYKETQNYVASISSMISDLTNQYNEQVA